MTRLRAAQNHPANLRIDIVSFAGMCSDRAELLRHVERYEGYAAAYVAPTRKRRAA